MNISTLLKCLIGDRYAIKEMAAHRSTIWLGLLFVISAGFAREYDGEDLLHEPWYLLIPLVASIGSAFILYRLVRLVALRRGNDVRPFYNGFRYFLGLYWMTAPLAWLYAIPVEQYMSPANATAANLFFLSIVSIWRVAFMIRVISVLYRCLIVEALFIVMFFADSVMMAVLTFTKLPVFNIMGGVRLSESEQTIQAFAFFVMFVGVVTLPFLAIGSVIVYFWKSKSEGWRWQLEENSESKVSKGLWILASASILFWALILPITQPQQINRYHAEQLLKSGQVAEGLDYMSELKQTDFPPHWDAPPRIGYGEYNPSLEEIFKQFTTKEPAPWVFKIFSEKMITHNHDNFELVDFDDEQLARLIELYEAYPKSGPQLASLLREQIKRVAILYEAISQDRERLLNKLLRLANQHEKGEVSIDALKAIYRNEFHETHGYYPDEIPEYAREPADEASPEIEENP